MEEEVEVGIIQNANIQVIEDKISNPKSKINDLNNALEQVKKVKQETNDQKLQKMSEKEHKIAQYYPCDIDYIVQENNQLYIVYGWKQTLFPLDKLPKQEREQIEQEFKSGKYRERLNRVPLTDSQLALIENILEDNLSEEVVEELKFYYRSGEIVPTFEDDQDGYKKHIFESFIKNKQKYTIRVGSLDINIKPGTFFQDSGISDENIITKRRIIDEKKCEILLNFYSIRHYRKIYKILKAKKYDLQEDQRHNQTKIVLETLKKMYVEAIANEQQVLQKLKSNNNSNNTSTTKQPQLQIKKIVKSDSPQPFRIRALDDDYVENKQCAQESNIKVDNASKKTKKVKVQQKTQFSVELISDIQKIFTYLKSKAEFKNVKMPINYPEKNQRKSIQEILDINTPYQEKLSNNQAFSDVETDQYNHIFTQSKVQNFVNHLKKTQKLQVSEINDLHLIK